MSVDAPEPAESQRKTTRLRQLLEGQRLAFLIGAHDGISAKIGQEAGFPALWASGLAISAANGVRDNNEATWTQVMEVLEFMCDATTVPILADGDSGHGDFNTVRRFVRKLEQRGVAGICLEDKLFPKTNSFLRSQRQPLADTGEFCGKLKAALDSRSDRDFVLVARTEALIAGRGLAEALRRCEAYREAGVHAIVVHSRLQHPGEVFAFLREWAGRLPVVLIPTTYYATPAAAFRESGVAAVIWANHLLRAAVTRMQEVAGQIRAGESVMDIEDKIAPLSEIFRLQGDAELAAAETRYLGHRPAEALEAIVLAATRGSGLDAATAAVPKAMLKIGSTTILDRLVAALRAHGVGDINVVAGYRKESVWAEGIRRVDNDAYATTGELVSLAAGLEHVSGDTIVAFGDILFRSYVAGLLVGDGSDVAIVVDRRFQERPRNKAASDFVLATRPGTDRAYLDDDVFLVAAEFAECNSRFHGEWIGLMKLSAKGAGWAREFIADRRAAGDLDRLQMIDLLNHFVANSRSVRIHYIDGHWAEVDSLMDLSDAQRF